MHRLFPPLLADEVEDLGSAYAWPERPCVRVNFVSSLDGAASVEGRSGGLGGAADKEVFGYLRSTCEVILVGAGTAAAEDYRPARVPVAVVSNRLSLAAGHRLFSPLAGSARPLLLTCAAASADRLAALAPHADLVNCGDEAVDLRLAIAELVARGFRRILCEGGPQLFGDLLAAGLVDELCLTVAPQLTSGPASRIALGPMLSVPARATLMSALENKSSLLLRYRLH